MLAATLLTGAILLFDRGSSCDLPPDSLRVYKVENAVILGQCHPPTGMNTAENQAQREFLIQHRRSILRTEGFRATSNPLNGKTAIFARIAATETYETLIPNLPATDARYYTKLRDDQSEVLLTVTGDLVSGYTLMASHHYVLNGVAQATYITKDLLPSDLTSPVVLELDTRVNNDNASGNRGEIRIQVCARRGLGSCHTFTFDARFGTTAAPEFYLGSALIGMDSPVVRYCNLPAFTTTMSSGYTSVCPGPVAP